MYSMDEIDPILRKGLTSKCTNLQGFLEIYSSPKELENICERVSNQGHWQKTPAYDETHAGLSYSAIVVEGWRLNKSSPEKLKSKLVWWGEPQLETLFISLSLTAFAGFCKSEYILQKQKMRRLFLKEDLSKVSSFKV